MAKEGFILVGYTAGRLLGGALGVAGTALGAASHTAWYLAYLVDAGGARVDAAVTSAHQALRDSG